MNLVMQFRKCCNHPELFERLDFRSPFQMIGEFNDGINDEVWYNTPSTIELKVPSLVLDVVKRNAVIKGLPDLFSVFEVGRCWSQFFDGIYLLGCLIGMCIRFYFR